MEYELGKRLDSMEQMLYALCVAAGVLKEDTKGDKSGSDTEHKKKV